MTRNTGAITVFIYVGCVSTALSQSPRDLVEQLQSADASQRRQAADQMGQHTSEAWLVPALAAVLQDRDADVRWRAARALERFGPQAVPAMNALIAALKDPEPLVRAHAAHALGGTGPSARLAASALANAMLDPEPLVRRAAVEALGKIRPGPRVTIPLLTRTLKDAEPSVVLPALHTLADLGKPVVPLVIEALADEEACYWACLVLAEIGPEASEAVPALARTTQAAEPEVRMQALLALAEMGPAARTAVPAVVASMRDPESSVRYAAAYAFGRIGSSHLAGENALHAMLRDEDPMLQVVGAYALARVHGDDQPLLERLVYSLVDKLKHPEPQVRMAAVRALLEIDAPGELTSEALVSALADEDPQVLANVADAAAAQGQKIVPRLIRGLQNPKLKRMAVMVLARMGTTAKAAVPALVQAMADDDPAFRAEVQFALGALGPEAAEAVPALVASLDHDDKNVCLSACYALGKIGPQAAAAVPRLRANLDGDDSILPLVSALALMRIGPEDAQLRRQTVPLLAEGLQHDDELVRVESARALGELGSSARSAIPALEKATQDPRESVRLAAEEALQRIKTN